MAGNKIATTAIKFVHGLKEHWPDFDMTPNEFIHPTLNTVIIFFQKFVHEFGIKNDTITMLLNESFHQWQENETFHQWQDNEDIIFLYVLYSCAKRIYLQLDLTSVSYFALNFTNFINPSTDKHFVGRVSLLANYLYYVEEMTVSTIQPLKKRVLEEVHAVNDKNKKVNNLNDQLITLAFTQAKSTEKKQKLTNNNEILRNSLTEYGLNIEKMANNIEKLKTELKLLVEENDYLTDSLQKDMVKDKQFQDLIVKDHKTILAERYKVEKELLEEQTELNEIRKNLIFRNEREPLLFKNNEVMKSVIETLNSKKTLDTYYLQEECRIEKEKLLKEIKAVDKIDDEVRHQLNQLNQDDSELDIKIKATEQERSNSIAFGERETKHLKNDLNILKIQCDEYTKESAELNKNLELISRYCDEYKHAIDEDNLYCEKLLQDFLNVRSSVENKMLTILDSVKTKFNIV